MAKYSYTWAVEEFNGSAWRVKEMDTEVSPLKEGAYMRAKEEQLREQGWHLEPEQGQRLQVSYWGIHRTPSRRRKTAAA